MVFVTIGNATQGFPRLLNAIDEFAGAGGFGDEEVIVQSGHTADFQPQHCIARPFINMDEFDRLMEDASLIICHGGCTQLQAVRLGKVPVVMPRRKKYGEHVNDHQVQLVEALRDEGMIVPALEIADLGRAVAEARLRNTHKGLLPTSPMVSLVAQAVKELMATKAP